MSTPSSPRPRGSGGTGSFRKKYVFQLKPDAPIRSKLFGNALPVFVTVTLFTKSFSQHTDYEDGSTSTNWEDGSTIDVEGLAKNCMQSLLNDHYTYYGRAPKQPPPQPSRTVPIPTVNILVERRAAFI